MEYIGLMRPRPKERINEHIDCDVGLLLIDRNLACCGVIFFEEDYDGKETITQFYDGWKATTIGYICEYIDNIDKFKEYYEAHVKLYATSDYTHRRNYPGSGKYMSNIIREKFLSKIDSYIDNDGTVYITGDNPEWRKLLIKEKIVNAHYVNNPF